MWELERTLNCLYPKVPDSPPRLAIVGAGRLGAAFQAALDELGLDVSEPLPRGADVAGAQAVLLCVPDTEIARAAALIAPGPLVGHCSGATGLDVLAPHQAFSMHPLMTVSGADDHRLLAGAGAAVAGDSQRALAFARQLALALGMHPVEVAERDRVIYHAAAAVASNFVVTLEAAAERLAASAGIQREHLVPLVKAAVDNWARLGPERALTGPIARGDTETVTGHRRAISERAPDLLALFDALADATLALATGGSGSGQTRPEADEAEPGTALPGDGRGLPPSRAMRVIRTAAELREALAGARRAGRSIGLVPTMGALHDGHLSLVRRAREQCDVVVMSLFVNPAQFNGSGDLTGYPRDEQRDAALAAEAGVDYLLAPEAQEIYPPGFSTSVTVTGITEQLEGAQRGRGHFDGVATVVTKLLSLTAPDAAYFGCKDAQQAIVIRRLVTDLALPVRIELCPTVRAEDGLALSSRNALLSPAERRRAPALYRALGAARDAVLAGESDPASARAHALTELDCAGVELEYLELVEAETMAPVQRLEGDLLAVIAARVGRTRLIDNIVIHVPAPVKAAVVSHPPTFAYRPTVA